MSIFKFFLSSLKTESIGFKILTIFLVTTGLIITVSKVEAACLRSRSDRYSATANKIATGGGFLAIFVRRPPDPARILLGGAAVAGTSIGELVNDGIGIWWDPILEVIPNDPENIFTPISDTKIFEASDDLFRNLVLDINPELADLNINLADVKTLNELSPGLGDASINFFTSGVRAYVHVLQGAAAASQKPFGDPLIRSIASQLNNDLITYREATLEFASYLDQFDFFPELTANEFSEFLTNVKQNGATALPPGEVNLGEGIFDLANVRLKNRTLADVLVSQLSEGDITNETSLFPSDGFTLRQLLENGASQGGSFDIDCTTCDIAVPEPSSTLSLLALGTLGAASTFKRKLKSSKSSEKETTKVS
jgi:hypothetical protein